jgi:hypothetical protein
MDLGKSKILKVTKYDSELNPIKIVGFHEESFALGSVINPMQSMIYFHATKDGRLIWLVTSIYEFHIVDASEKQIQTIIKDYTPRKITADEQKKLLKERYGDAPPQITFAFPETYPPVENFIGDDEGRLFVKTYETDGKGGLWYDVFDTEGRCITRISLPAGEMAFVVKKGKLYTLIQEDEDGNPIVKRYAMEWK